MAQPQDEVQALLPSGHRRPSRLRIQLRRKKLPTARLGCKRRPRVVAFWRSIKEVRSNWATRLRCTCMVKKLNQFFGKEIAAVGAGFDAFQKRLLMEISFAVPLLGASLSLPLP